jgi:EmrB/QacA subfamily drug resistance transporter
MLTPLDSSRARNAALALLAMTQFLIVIDSSIVTVAIPSIGDELGIPADRLTWVINAYVLAFGGLLLLGGRVADVLGRRNVFLVGIALFTAASLLGGLAQTELWLFGARAVQGLGAALAAPAALAIITTTFDGAERNRALAVWGAVAGAGGAAGVLLGGVLTEYLGWQWVLFVNVPFGLLILWQGPLRLPGSRSGSADRGFDVAGAITVSAAIAVTVYAIVDAPTSGWSSIATLIRVAVGLILFVAFIVMENRSKNPMLPLSIFRLRTLRGANIVGVLIGMALVSMFFLTTLYLQQVLEFTALAAGLSFLPLSLAIIVAAGVASHLVTRFGVKPVLVCALLFLTAGLAWFSVVPPDGTYLVDVLGPSVLSGIGLGLSFVPITVAAVVDIDSSKAGLASGLINASQQIGGALGLAIVASIASSITSSLLAKNTLSEAAALSEGLGMAFLVGAGIAALGALCAIILIPASINAVSPRSRIDSA